MSLSEFDMIARFFRGAGLHRDDTLLSIGDDAALIQLDEGQSLRTVLLQWRVGIDYDRAMPAADTGRRLLAQGINKLQALNAKPCWITLSVSFEQLDESWLKHFSQGLLDLASQYSIELIGGDTTRGAETLRLHVLGTSRNDQSA